MSKSFSSRQKAENGKQEVLDRSTRTSSRGEKSRQGAVSRGLEVVGAARTVSQRRRAHLRDFTDSNGNSLKPFHKKLESLSRRRD